MKIRKQFSIRSIFVVTSLTAFSIVALSLRPKPDVTVEYCPQGPIIVDGVEIDSRELIQRIDSERSWRRLWLVSDQLILRIPINAVDDSNDYLRLDDPNGSHRDILSNILNHTTTRDEYSVSLQKLQELLAAHPLCLLDAQVIEYELYDGTIAR